MREWYVYGDERMKEYRDRIRKEFRKARLTMPFDEINAMTAGKAARRLYQRIDRLGRKMMLDVAEMAYREAWAEADPDGAPPKEKMPDEDWLEDWLLEYNPVTKYVYAHEVDRKRARFFESIVSDAESGNRIGLELDYRTASSLWLRQVEQFLTDAEDAAVLRAYRDLGVDRAQWIAEIDGKECSVCRKRHRKIYPIERFPPKPHYRCRCMRVPILNIEKERDES